MTFSSRPCRAWQGQQSLTARPALLRVREGAQPFRMPGPKESEDGTGATSRTETQEEKMPALRMLSGQETTEELKNQRARTSLVVQRVRLSCHSRGVGLTPGWGTKIPHASSTARKKIKQPYGIKRSKGLGGGAGLVPVRAWALLTSPPTPSILEHAACTNVKDRRQQAFPLYSLGKGEATAYLEKQDQAPRAPSHTHSTPTTAKRRQKPALGVE